MRILHTHNAPYYPVTLGGSQVADRGLLELLANKGHTVMSVCTAVIDDKNLKYSTDRTREDWLADLHALGGRIVGSEGDTEIMTLGGVEIRSTANLAPRLAAEITRFAPDRVLCGQYGSSDSVIRTVAETAPGRGLFLAHGVMGQPFGPFTVFPNPAKAALLKSLRGVIAASDFVADYFARYGGIAAKRCYFPAYGTGPFRSLGDRSGPITMVHPSWVKGTAIVRGLAEAMPHQAFRVIASYGTMPDDLAALQLPNVELRHGSPSADGFLAGASALLFPTLGWEAFGLIVVEAMLRGVPVFASDLGGLRESALGAAVLCPVTPVVIGDAIDASGRRPTSVPPQDVTPWRDAIENGFTDRYDALVETGRERAAAFVERVNAEAARFVEHL